VNTTQIRKGDIYWLKLEQGISHPHVVIEIEPLIVCALTTNMKKANMPGNVVLEAGEAGLEKQSIIEVTKTQTVTFAQLDVYVGTLDLQRVDETIAGIKFVEKSFF
jgi:mRNA interferase MazF